MEEVVSLKNVKFPRGCPKVEFYRRLDYCELVLYVFTRCNMNCSFCFEKDKKDIDMSYINSLPDKALAALERDLVMQETAKSLHVRFLGGELFSDDIPDSYFEIYSDLINKLRDKISTRYPDVKVEFLVTSNGVYNNVDRVIKFLEENNLSKNIAISYDFIGRFKDEETKLKTLTTIKKLAERGYKVSICTVMTKCNISYILHHQDEFRALVDTYKAESIVYNFYIPNDNWEEDMPTDHDMWQFLRMCIVEGMYFVPLVKYLLESFIHKKCFSKTCECKFIPTVMGEISTTDCIQTTSTLDRSLFYGEYLPEVTEENVSDVKASLGIVKRGCLSCENYEYCPQMCWGLVSFKYYEANLCPLWCVYSLLRAQPELTKNYLEWKEKNV